MIKKLNYVYYTYTVKTFTFKQLLWLPSQAVNLDQKKGIMKEILQNKANDMHICIGIPRNFLETFKLSP